MKSKEIIRVLKTLKYFDANLKLSREKVDTIDRGDVSKQKRLHREAELVMKYLAIFCWTQLNDKTLLTPQEFKFLITNSKEDKVYISRINKYFPRMTLEEFDTFIDVYNTLKNEAN